MTKHTPIGNIPNLQTKSYIMIFIGVFASLWTFIEPLGFFGLATIDFNKFGITGYITLFITALFISIIPAKIIKYKKFNNQEFISFIVESSSDGKDHYLKAPKNTQIFDLINLIIEYLETTDAKDKIRFLRFNYDSELYLKQEKENVKLNNSKTISESSIKNDDRLFIMAVPRKDLGIRFSIR
jgi:hypothetical protein